jgi:hypothetical protein
MAITKLSGSSLTNITKYDSFLAGNNAYVPPSFESIATLTGNGSSQTLTFSSIPSTYKHLQIRMIAREATGGFASGLIYMTFNGSTASNYSSKSMNTDGGGNISSSNAGPSNSEISIPRFVQGTAAASGYMGAAIIDIYDYATAGKTRTVRAMVGNDDNNTVLNNLSVASGLWNSTSAITSISLQEQRGAFATTTTIALYGIKG